MKLHEYQAKAILSRYGIKTPRGQVASSPQEAVAATKAMGGKAVLKAQVHAGGRGKAGGVKVAADPAEAGTFADAMIGTTLVTFQTGPQGAPVHQVNCVIRVRFGASGVRQVSVSRRALSFEMISQR